jgi:hypothetical protein
MSANLLFLVFSLRAERTITGTMLDVASAAKRHITVLRQTVSIASKHTYCLSRQERAVDNGAALTLIRGAADLVWVTDTNVECYSPRDVSVFKATESWGHCCLLHQVYTTAA